MKVSLNVSGFETEATFPDKDIEQIHKPLVEKFTRLFEQKKERRFIKQYESLNLWSKFKTLPFADQKDATLLKAMRHYDYTVNVQWVMSHYHAALHYLNQGKEPLEATGGSDWVKYMHPKYQKRIFFPEVWSQKEREEWGQNVN